MSISAVAVTPDFWWDAAVGTAKMSEQEPRIKTEETPGLTPVVRTEKAPDPKLEVGTEKSSETVVRTERTQDPEPAPAIAVSFLLFTLFFLLYFYSSSSFDIHFSYLLYLLELFELIILWNPNVDEACVTLSVK